MPVRVRSYIRRTPKFTRRHYEETAKVLRTLDPPGRQKSFAAFAEIYAQDNPTFDRSKFFTAVFAPAFYRRTRRR